MKYLNKIGNYIFYLGVLSCCFGLIYITGISNRIELKCAAEIGLIMIATGGLLSFSPIIRWGYIMLKDFKNKRY